MTQDLAIKLILTVVVVGEAGIRFPVDRRRMSTRGYYRARGRVEAFEVPTVLACLIGSWRQGAARDAFLLGTVAISVMAVEDLVRAARTNDDNSEEESDEGQ
jgi:hypothetical protein